MRVRRTYLKVTYVLEPWKISAASLLGRFTYFMYQKPDYEIRLIDQNGTTNNFGY